MKHLKITPPEGYEIDKEMSTFEHIVFKPIQKQLPKSWEELDEIKGWYVDTGSGIEDKQVGTYRHNRNVFVTEEQAEAAVALAQLTQLREVYRQGWKPDWKDGSAKDVIEKYGGELVGDSYFNRSFFLAFQSEEVRDQFLKNFRELIEKASPLLFG
jgi:hypothetical protein